MPHTRSQPVAERLWRRLVNLARGRLPDLAAFGAAMLAACLAALLATGLSGCGGGVGSEGTGSFASGSITGFGSVIVGGVHFDESSARLEDEDGQAQDRSALALGMVVQITAGPASTQADGSSRAVASLVRSNRALQGPLQAVDSALGRLQLLGQTVLMSADTVIDERLVGGLAGLVAGQWLQVFGFYDASQTAFVATRIAWAGSNQGVRISGPVDAVDRQQKTFRIGGQTYHYNSLAEPAGLDNGVVLNLVLSSVLPDAGRWQVGMQSRKADAPSQTEGAELNGRISRLLSATRFELSGVVVDSSAASVQGTLAVGSRVEVTGVLSGGVLLARKVSSSDDSHGQAKAYELNGLVQTLDLAGQRLLLRDGVRDTVVGLARSGLVFSKGQRSDLAVGRRLRVLAQPSADRTLLEATEIRFDN